MTTKTEVALWRLGAYLTIAMLAAFVSSVSADIVAPTRVTAFDWQCQDSAGVKISDHQRIELAYVSCLNNPAGAYVQGGRYRVNRVVVTDSTARLSWIAPTTNTDGSALTNLTGYRIVYGTSAAALTQTIQVADPALSTYTVSNLQPGTYYFAVIALTANAESALSNIASKTVM